ncbi:hypothetical protein AVDCRST_MAG94-3457 [uncultured Leptolyngbya sp.]|uniref:Uncharacterized protein n=1 Tax=uncultured Leptolyngbya sp. TaxID=332963 RepID=A0A6J4ML06_9CYAN|nr:hypothetical protein AVDCRST_MAG94-3457 [uncultured Leptolyngbya sp.]
MRSRFNVYVCARFNRAFWLVARKEELYLTRLLELGPRYTWLPNPDAGRSGLS